jgi:hypothetical protein
MKTRMIKVAFVLALIGSGSALSLASGIENKANELRNEIVVESTQPKITTIEDLIKQKLSYMDSGQLRVDRNLVGIWLSTDEIGTVKVLYIKNATSGLKQLINRQLDGIQVPLDESECNRQFHFVLHYNLV